MEHLTGHGMLAISIVGMIVIVVIFTAVVVTLIRRRGVAPVVQRPILTNAELAFHAKLVRAVARIGGLSVHPQVAMSAFIQPNPGLSSEAHLSVFRSFSQKRPDFVLVDPAMNVRLVVELDDGSHDAQKDADRDRMVLSAGIRTVRFPDGRRATVDHVQRMLQIALDG